MSEQGMFGAPGTGDTSGYGGLARTAASTGSSQRPYGGYFDEVACEARKADGSFKDFA
jgi:NADH-quinone oxidoreductase subunit C